MNPLSRLALTGLLLSGLLLGDMTLAVADTEPNNTFASRELLASGITTVSGMMGTAPLDFTVADFVFNETLTSGSILSRTVNGQSAGGLFLLYTDNTASGVDTVLRISDENGDPLSISDDGSPLGNGLGSILAGLVNADGSVRYDVSGFPDFDFIGDHTESGDFDTYLKFVEGDVDFYSFTGLVPNSQYIAEIVGGDTDTILGLFDSTGTLLDFDDDTGTGFYSRLSGITGSDGVLNLAVTSFADFGFLGQHFGAGGSYALSLQNVPEPGSVAFAVTAGAALLGLARKRRK